MNNEFRNFFITECFNHIEKIFRRIDMRLYKGKSKNIGKDILILIREEVKYFVDIGPVSEKWFEKIFLKHTENDLLSFSKYPLKDISEVVRRMDDMNESLCTETLYDPNLISFLRDARKDTSQVLGLPNDMRESISDFYKEEETVFVFQMFHTKKEPLIGTDNLHELFVETHNDMPV